MFFIENDFSLGKTEHAITLSSAKFSNEPLRLSYSKDADHVNLENIEEDFSYWAKTSIEFPYARYLVIRAGHTKDLYLPLLEGVYIKTSKKDRKMVIYGPNKQQINNLARAIFNYRQPSVYTGRGIRRKHLKPIRKAGKKDKQKGKAF